MTSFLRRKLIYGILLMSFAALQMQACGSSSTPAPTPTPPNYQSQGLMLNYSVIEPIVFIMSHNKDENLPPSQNSNVADADVTELCPGGTGTVVINTDNTLVTYDKCLFVNVTMNGTMTLGASQDSFPSPITYNVAGTSDYTDASDYAITGTVATTTSGNSQLISFDMMGSFVVSDTTNQVKLSGALSSFNKGIGTGSFTLSQGDTTIATCTFTDYDFLNNTTCTGLAGACGLPTSLCP